MIRVLGDSERFRRRPAGLARPTIRKKRDRVWDDGSAATQKSEQKKKKAIGAGRRLSPLPQLSSFDCESVKLN